MLPNEVASRNTPDNVAAGPMDEVTQYYGTEACRVPRQCGRHPRLPYPFWVRKLVLGAFYDAFLPNHLRPRETANIHMTMIPTKKIAHAK